jgi:uncharacterized protein YbaP (TraB family)
MVGRRWLGGWILTAALVLTIAGAQARQAEQGVQARSCPAVPKALTRDDMTVGMRNARDRGFLWRISKDGHTSYLYGTMHILKHDWMYPGATVLRAVKASDRIALELDLLDADVAQRLSVAIRAAASDTALPEPLAARVRVEAERACVPLRVLSKMFPEMQVATLVVLTSRSDGMYGEYASDVFLSGLARALHKPVVSLETPELQMQAVRLENTQERIAILEKSLAELRSKNARALQLRMGETWAGSRLDELQRYPEWCECIDTEAERRYWHRIGDDRNPGLASGIAAIHESGQTVFAAVGSLHMIGAAGLPTLFAQRGYRVEFVTFPP